MSVRYTATWYDVTQAQQQATHHTHRHVPAPPAGLQFSHSHRHTAGRGGGGRLNCMYIECVSATPNPPLEFRKWCCKVARQKFRPKSSKGATKKKFLAEFWLILPKTGRKGAAENLYIVY